VICVRGVYHSSWLIESFLSHFPTKCPSGEIDNLYYFTRPGCAIFAELVKDGPGRPPTAQEFIDAYMKIQTADADTAPRRNRMQQIYIGLMRDYHAGALLVECQDVDHVYWSEVLDADGGIDYIIGAKGRYAAVKVHPGLGDPSEWMRTKANRKKRLEGMFPNCLGLGATRDICKGGIYLVSGISVKQLVSEIMEHGVPRPRDSRSWNFLSLTEVSSPAKQEQQGVLFQ